VSELRLRAIATLEAAHAYLPEFIADFNRRFGRAPADPQPVWRRPPGDLPLVLGCRYRRVVARDNTVCLGTRWVQLRGSRSYAGVRVEVRELLDGRLVVLHDGRLLGETPAPLGGFVRKPRRSLAAARRASRVRPTPRSAPSRTTHPRRTRAATPCPPIHGSSPKTVTSVTSNSVQGGHFHVAVRADIFIDQRQRESGNLLDPKVRKQM